MYVRFYSGILLVVLHIFTLNTYATPQTQISARDSINLSDRELEGLLYDDAKVTPETEQAVFDVVKELEEGGNTGPNGKNSELVQLALDEGKLPDNLSVNLSMLLIDKLNPESDSELINNIIMKTNEDVRQYLIYEITKNLDPNGALQTFIALFSGDKKLNITVGDSTSSYLFSKSSSAKDDEKLISILTNNLQADFGGSTVTRSLGNTTGSQRHHRLDNIIKSGGIRTSLTATQVADIIQKDNSSRNHMLKILATNKKIQPGIDYEGIMMILADSTGIARDVAQDHIVELMQGGLTAKQVANIIQKDNSTRNSMLNTLSSNKKIQSGIDYEGIMMILADSTG